MKRALVLGLALVLVLAPWTSYAQVSPGLYGTVTDDSAAPMPGATVTLTSEVGTRTTSTGTRGEFRFLNLDTGVYTVTVNLAGFTTVKRQLSIRSGENVTVDFGLKVAQLEETITVTAETPLVDPKKRGTATTMTAEELQNVPNARDPWGVLKNVPGVLIDRVNIAGNENGQQASVAGKGSDSSDKMFTLDGINITDMSATGASPTYFDFEAFQEINVSTGGNDLQVQTGGIGINLVTKRGTNAFHGSARFLVADEDWSTSNLPDKLRSDARLKGAEFADHVKQIKDYGFELGGPVIKDKLWFYGTYGKQDIKLLRLNQTPDDTLLPSYNIKLNWQALDQTLVSAFYFVGKKQKFGRGVGYPVTETDGFLWNQDNAYVDGGLPGGLWKVQVDQTFSQNFFVSAKASYYDTGFGLFPRGGTNQNFTIDYVRGEAIGSYQTYQAVRPQKLLNVDGSYFMGGLGGNHELKFGFGYRDLKTTSSSVQSGDGLAGFINGPGEDYAWVVRNGITEYGGKYTSAYVGDVYTRDRLTINAGVRWDLQTAKNLGSQVPANKAFPNLLPALSYAGDEGNVIEWNDISPRVGISYALDESRRTVVRASFARYADQLSFGTVARVNPVQWGFLAYGWSDRNGDRLPQAGEVQTGNFLYSFRVNPSNPTALVAVNRIDKNYDAKHDNEFIVAVDREVANNFAVGAAFTYRKATDWGDYRPFLAGACDPASASLETCPIVTPNLYQPIAPATAGGFTVPRFQAPAALVTAGAGGRLYTNRDGYSTKYKGLELTATKRLSNRWMARLAFAWNDWTEGWDDGVTPTTITGHINRLETDPLVQGGQVALLSGGSGKASFYSSVKWQAYANALVQLPWSIDLSGAIFAKQGGSLPTSVRAAIGRDGTANLLATPEVDTKRYDTVVNVDARLARTFTMKRTSLQIAAELFNVMNNDVVLSQFRFAGPTLGRIEEIIAPRTLRLGARFQF